MRRLAAAAVAAAALLSVSAGSAQATQAGRAHHHAPITAKGRVTARSSLVIVRSRPSTSAAVRGALRAGEVIPLLCKANSQAIRGNHLWYKVSERPSAWISASLVRDIGRAPAWCASRDTARQQAMEQHAKRKHAVCRHATRHDRMGQLRPGMPGIVIMPHSHPMMPSVLQGQQAPQAQAAPAQAAQAQGMLGMQGFAQLHQAAAPHRPHPARGIHHRTHRTTHRVGHYRLPRRLHRMRSFGHI